jgi:hypothetical protein
MVIRGRQSGLVSALTWVAAAWATTAAYNPFKVPRDQFSPNARVVALLPLALPSGLRDPEAVREKFNPLIENAFPPAGIKAVPSRDVAAIREAAIKRLGGMFDPATGKIDDAKRQAVWDAIRHELKEKFAADAILFPEIMPVTVRFSGYSASRHGASENPYNVGFWWLLWSGTGKGSTTGVSLGVRLQTIPMPGADLYINAGGIHLTHKATPSGDFVSVPEDEVLGDIERNTLAVHRALVPMLDPSAVK